MYNINISYLKKEEDLEIIDEEYANYYNNSILKENLIIFIHMLQIYFL